MASPISSSSGVNVLLSISAKGLRDADVFSKSDPKCVLSIKDGNDWTEVGRTETIDNNLNPVFSRQFEVNYVFEQKQVLKFAMYDIDCESDDLSKHDFLGSVESTLASLISCTKRTLKLHDSTRRKQQGSITVSAERVRNEHRSQVSMKFRAKGLDKVDFLGKSDPYLEIRKELTDGSFVPVHRTETIKMTLNPQWAPFNVTLTNLCNGDFDRKLKLVVNDWNKSGEIKHIGECETTYRKLTRLGNGQTTFKLVNKQKSKDNKSSGTLHLMECRNEDMWSIGEYLHGGTHIKTCMAVDMTYHDDLSSPDCLHYGRENSPFARAIKDVGEILEDYDSDKLIPAFGFGAKLPGVSVCSDRFALNGNPERPECEGISGVLQAYCHALETVQMSGPSHFSPLIEHMTRQAQNDLTGAVYHILLILTNGVICDMEATLKSLASASHFPMSIMIVGMGEEDFEAMEMLKNHTSVPRVDACRAIVQFVRYKDIERSGTCTASKVLGDVPNHLVSYMHKQSIRPTRRANISTMV